MIIVSACLLGYPCKYNGKSNLCREVIEYLKDKDYLAVCPEQLGNLPTPRAKSELYHCSPKDVFQKKGKIITENGKDVSASFIQGALKAFDFAINYEVSEAIVKENSPSCGHLYTYDGNFNQTRISQSGLFTYLLKKKNVKILTENNFKEQKK